MTIGDAALTKALHDLTSREDVSEAVVLSTCHRPEISAVAERLHAAYAAIRYFIAETAFLAPDDFRDHPSVHSHSPAFSPPFSVAPAPAPTLLRQRALPPPV